MIMIHRKDSIQSFTGQREAPVCYPCWLRLSDTRMPTPQMLFSIHDGSVYYHGYTKPTDVRRIYLSSSVPMGPRRVLFQK